MTVYACAPISKKKSSKNVQHLQADDLAQDGSENLESFRVDLLGY